MSTTTMYVPREHARTSMWGTQDRIRPIRLGTYRDGQRAVAMTVTYTLRIGSFGDIERR